MNRLVSVILLSLCLLTVGHASEPFTVLVTGETHAAIEGPNGGIAGRAALIQKLRKKNPQLLLLDAGGALAGGLYDPASISDSLDQMRSILYLRAMKAAGYDAMAVGDEELLFGSAFLQRAAREARFPLLSANLDSATGQHVLPYTILTRNGARTAIIGLTTQDAFLTERALPKVTEPFRALKRALDQLNGKADAIIVLSHLGEELSNALADSFPQVNLIVNGHRKTSVEPLRRRGNTWVTHFSYLGQEIFELRIQPGKQNRVDLVRHPVPAVSRPDSIVNTLVGQWAAIKAKAPVRLDLYIMSECPYGLEALGVLLKVKDRMRGRILLNLYYIISKEYGKWSSLHGEGELAEDVRQAAIQAFHSKALPQYLHCMLEDGKAAACLAESGINRADLDAEIKTAGDRILTANFVRTERLNIHSSPTLYIDNQPYEGATDETTLLRLLCARGERASSRQSVCDSIPQCHQDRDCRAPGKEGKCFEPGTLQSRCVLRDAPSFELTVITDSTMTCASDIEDVIRSTTALLPGAKAMRMAVNDTRAAPLISKYEITQIPTLLLGKHAARSQDFGQLESVLEFRADRYVLKSGVVRNYVLLKRKKISNQVVLFFSPLSEPANDILNRFITLGREQGKNLASVRVLPVLELAQDSIRARNGLPELEESARQMAMTDSIRLVYVDQRRKNWNSSYWEEPVIKAGLNPAQIKAQAGGNATTKELRRAAELHREIGSPGFPAFFLINNREVVQPQNEADLGRILSLMK